MPTAKLRKSKVWSKMYVMRSSEAYNICFIANKRAHLTSLCSRGELSYEWFKRQGIALERGMVYEIDYAFDLISAEMTAKRRNKDVPNAG